MARGENEEEVTAFLNENSSDAYEKLVDRLLASPRYGERMAMWWLDGARYADSHGYQADWERYQWPWRDWVINAFNTNMPFDRFVVEQIAGDLFPQPTLDQQIAMAGQEVIRVQQDWYGLDDAYGPVLQGLQQISEEIDNDTL